MRKTSLGYPVLSCDLHGRIFGKEKTIEMSRSQKEKAEKLLNEFDIETPVDYPKNLYDGPLPLPDLKGNILREHFEKIAEDQIGHYKKLADEFSKCKLPPLPHIFSYVFEPGWHRYENTEEGWKIEKVPFPIEEAFTFDTETFVHKGAFPIIGTAMSAKAAYVWLAAEVINPEIPEKDWQQFDLIPIGEGKFIAGHNISYDRVRAQEGYTLERTKPENFYFDTLSAHVGVSGLASGQRWLYSLAGKEPEELTDEEKLKLKYAPKWLEQGSTNSLVQCYNFHVSSVRKYFDEEATELGAIDKKVRDIFVTATELSEIRTVLTDALEYALKDAFYTAELFQAIWPKYLDSTPSMVALCGHYHLNGSIVPLDPEWQKWIENVEKVYQEHNDEMTKLCRDLVWKNYEEWKQQENQAAWVRKDPWLSQLDWEVKTVKGKYANVPNWMRPFIKDPETPIGVKSRLAHLLLKLEWEGQPLTWIEGEGWCYWSDTE